MARWGAVVTATSWLQQPDCVWAGAGQADSASAEFVRGADGGGGAGGDAAAEAGTASHGVGNLLCFWFLGKKGEVSRMKCLFLLWDSYILLSLSVGPIRRHPLICIYATLFH